MKKKLHFLIIDPQVDFCDPKGNLYVGDPSNPKVGAIADSIRLANLISRMSKQITEIHCTLDTHRFIHIAHPIFWWSDKESKHPDPFTLIFEDDILNGKWRTTVPAWMPRATEYVKNLKKNNRYILCIWPPHCLIGSPGHNVIGPVFKSFIEFESDPRLRNIDYVTKGSNMWTEHYSAVQADVIDSTDSTTILNKDLIKILEDADVIAISGQALSHCVANTIRDIVKDFGPETIKKFVLISDTTSAVSDLPGSTMFKDMADGFIKEMTSKGMQICIADDFNI